MEGHDGRLLLHGDFVNVRTAGWLGQIIDFRQVGFNEPEYHLRIWTGAVLFKEWFSECEIMPVPEAADMPEGDNVVNFTEFKGKLNKDTPTGGAA